MPKKPPAYRQRSGYDQALVTLTDAVTKQRRDYWLGEFKSPRSRENYHRLLADWEARDRRLPPPLVDEDSSGSETEGGVTVNDVCLAYWRFATSYYEGRAEWHLRGIIRILRHFFGSQPAASFGPNALRTVRDAMIKGDASADRPRKPWSRPYANSQVHLLCRMFKWAASNEMVPVSVYQQLKTVPALRRGRTAAREPAPVHPVPLASVNAVRPFLSRQVNALIDLQLFSGARGGELLKLRPIDIEIDDRSGVWTVRPERHKTAHLGLARTIYLGPRAQAVIRPFLADRPLDAYLFSPAEAEQERRAALTAARTTPRSCGNTTGSNRSNEPRKKPGNHYTPESYCRAIVYACDQAFTPPAHLRRQPRIAGDPRSKPETTKSFRPRMTLEMRAELRQWRRDHRWHPHQLRHTAATLIRREFGLEAARIALGHSSALVTDAVYADRDMDRVVDMMKRIG